MTAVNSYSELHEKQWICSRAGSAALTGGSEGSERTNSGHGRQGVGRSHGHGGQVDGSPSGRGRCRTRVETHAGTAFVSDRSARATSLALAPREADGSRVSHRSLDGAAGRGPDPSAVRRRLSLRLPAGVAAAAGLQSAEAASPGQAEESSGHRSVGGRGLAPHSKKLPKTKPTSS